MKTVCISLDFELRWGVRHLYRGDFSKYKSELDGAKEAARSLCDYFEKREIPSSWATVGALALENWDDFFAEVPLDQLDFWSDFPMGHEELLKINEKYYFAPDMVKHIHLNSFSELASHTFTHLFCSEPHVSQQMFLDDGMLLNKVFWSKFAHQPKSIVFPRNQENFLNHLPDLGIDSYRATELGDSAQANTFSGNTIIHKGSRFLSGINPLLVRSSAFNSTFSRASMFLRLNLTSYAWRLHLARIKNELIHLSDGECFHIWWHPHNLGHDTEKKLKRVDEVMNIILSQRDKRDLKILSMKELNILAKNRMAN